jgi:alginate O-acetyltransferase complex protein AlgI
MIFSSPRFLLFLVALLCILAGPWKHNHKKWILAVASCVFYAAWNYRYLALLLFISVVDYYCALRIHRNETQLARKRWLMVSIVSNLGLLSYFKYTNFFLDNFNLLTGGHIPHLNILLPAGISFYTFKTMSYTIDVYRRELEPCRRWMDYATFVTFFPELIAGPIVRASVFLPQMTRPIGPARARLALGSSIFLLGLTKKSFIADRLATIADPVFISPHLYSGMSIWAAVLAYTFQIYCDFSGYSDMAIGTATMIGYDLPQNFAMPYLSRDITEFWRRWHITLSSWLRDYLYIPLGGNRRGAGRTYLNLFITMALGGLWHGASWNFVLWGVLHGSALAVHKLIRRLSDDRPLIPAWLSAPSTFMFVVLCWVPFRSTSIANTRLMLTKMLTLQGGGAHWFPSYLPFMVATIAAGHAIGVVCAGALTRESWRARLRGIASQLGLRLRSNPISGWHVGLSLYPVGAAFVTILWVLILGLFSTGNVKPFIYFQF